jgi:hypothetical protein
VPRGFRNASWNIGGNDSCLTRTNLSRRRTLNTSH